MPAAKPTFRVHHTVDPWAGRLRTCAERRGAEAAYWLDALVGYDAPDEDVREFYGRCESPIETAMLTALVVVAAEYGLTPIVDSGREFCQPFGDLGPDVFIIPQERIGPYRGDFGILSASRWAVVECDGAKYHETDEAIRRDDQRDAAIKGLMAAQGLGALADPVMRFPGRLIWADAFACAERALLRLA